jgi:hypothetical protein
MGPRNRILYNFISALLAASFYERLSGYGPVIVCAKTKGGCWLGGYNPLGFDGYGSDKVRSHELRRRLPSA